MHSLKQVSFGFQLFLISAAVLVAMAVPADSRPSEGLCAAGASRSSKLDMKSLENSGYCHYKVCEDKYGYKNGKTRNPDVIYRIVCEETADCKQVYLTVDVAHYTNGSQTNRQDKQVPAGCLYSKADLRDSITVDDTKPNTFS
jgi:hypothetical protein